MPLITVTLQQGRTADEKRAVLDAIHAALVGNGIPEADRFQRLIELSPENFFYDRSYPNLASPRSEKFVLIELLLSVGRSVKVKKEILKTLLDNLRTGAGLAPTDVMIVFVETRWENWAFSDGVLFHV